MASSDSSGSKSKGGGLWARLFGVSAPEPEAKTESEQKREEFLPEWDTAPASAVPLATPVPAQAATAVPLAQPISAVPVPPTPAEAADELAPAEPDTEPVQAPLEFCPSCQAPRKGTQAYCDDCG